MNTSRLTHRILTVALALAMAGVLSCGEETPPASQPQAVKQKITDQQAKTPETPPAGNQVAPQPENATAPADMPTTREDGAADGGQPISELIKESMAIAVGYDPKGRFDPFEPLFKDEPSAPSATMSKDNRQKRIPQTPLERVAISQLKLSAIMRIAKGNSAIVEDATGKGYVIRKGTYIGLNSGQVTQIDKNRVVIEEEIENVMGELVIQSTELKLQKPAGEL